MHFRRRLARPNSSIAFLALFASTLWGAGRAEPFDPWEYQKLARVASCPATSRGPNLQNVAIDLEYVDINPTASKAMIMVHGWPGLWSTWGKQIQEFENDYRLIVPNLRGFGRSTHPADLRSSGTLNDIVHDLVCILKHSGVKSALCMGHDWGSSVCYEAARAFPDVFSAVVGVVVPYVPSQGPFIPTSHLAALVPTLNYQLFFDNRTTTAIGELDGDIQRTLRATLRSVASPPPVDFLKSTTSFLGAWNGSPEIPRIPFLSPSEEDYLVTQYKVQGFAPTLEFYTTEDRFLGWEVVHNSPCQIIQQPVLAVYPTQDPVADWSQLAAVLGSSSFITHYTPKTMQGAHWVHMEFPEIFNHLVRSWLVENGL